MKKKKIACWTACTVAVLALLLTILSVVLLDMALTSDNCNRDLKGRLDGYYRETPTIQGWIDSLRTAKAIRDTFITMPDGERQHAIFVRSPKANGRTAMLVHGYCDNCYGQFDISSIYNKLMGYNIILPDLHAHGLSGGKDIQMGWKDRLDILHWADVAERMFRQPSTPSQMVIHGVSMGAATVMCAAGEQTPSYIKCFVEDCGYTSVWDEFHSENTKRYSLPDFPILYIASAACKIKHGWSFGEASPLKQVAKCNKPMMFIHGGNDDFVPTEMVNRLYAAKPGVKALWIAPGSGHAVSFREHQDEYAKRVMAFVTRYVRPTSR